MLFSDRRSGQVHDIGTTTPPDWGGIQRMQTWGNVQSDVHRGLAATVNQFASTGMPRTQTVVPGGPAPRTARPAASPYDFRPNITSPAEQRARAGREQAASRTASWAQPQQRPGQVLGGSGAPRSAQRTPTVLPGLPQSSFLSRRIASGPSFAQRAARGPRARML